MSKQWLYRFGQRCNDGDPTACVARRSLAVGRVATALGILGYFLYAGWMHAIVVHAAAPCRGVAVSSDNDLQAVINAAPKGATLCFAAGEYRIETPLNPKNNQKLIGVAGETILNGAKVITGFVPRGPDFVARGFLPKTSARDANCVVAGCRIEQDVFFDDAPLKRVLHAADLAPGTFYENFGANEIYLRDNPGGHKVEQAFAPFAIQSSSSGVTVRGFIVEKVANPAQFGAIDAEYPSGPGWLIQNNEVRFNHGAGITSLPPSATAGGSTISSNYVHHQGQEGIEGFGPNLLVEDNEIAFNNTAGFDPQWEAGGSKFAGIPEVTNLVFRRNDVHDNQGNGFWCDINCYNVLVEKNTVTNNLFTDPSTGNQVGYGIFFEISDRCVIRNNSARGKAPDATAPDFGFYIGGQIGIAETPNCEVYGNTVAGVNGIGMLQQFRNDSCDFAGGSNYPDGTPVCPNGSHGVHDTLIHDNVSFETVDLESGLALCCPEIAGLDTDTGDNSFFLSSNSHYVNNTYHLPDIDGAYFTWLNVLLTKDQWMANGQDTTGTFMSP